MKIDVAYTAYILISKLFSGGVWRTCAEEVASLVAHAQRATVGLGEILPPVEIYDQNIPSESKTRDLRNAIASLQDDILNLLVLHPDLRHSTRVRYAEKHGLDLEDIQSLELYLGAIYYGNSRLVSSSPEQVLKQIRQLSKTYKYERAGEGGLKRRYLYYLANTTHFSVPEMAHMLSLSEAQVYSELFSFGVSIEAQFSTRVPKRQWDVLTETLRENDKAHLIKELSRDSLLEVAKRLVQEGMEVENIAQALGVGRQALDFVLHYEHEKNRGVRWNRTVPGTGLSEEAYLRQQHIRGAKAQEIANALNEAFHTKPSDGNYRTAASVTAKLRVLFPTPPRTSPFPHEVRDPLHTDKFLKQGGKIQKDNALDFISRHYFQQDAWLADSIGVSLNTLQSFLRKHNIPTEGRRLRSREQSNETKVEEILEGHEAHRKEHLEQSLESFMNLESGPLLVLKDLWKFSRKTRESFQPLFQHLPEQTRTALVARIESRITNKTAGAAALNKSATNRRGASQQIQDVLYWISKLTMNGYERIRAEEKRLTLKT